MSRAGPVGCVREPGWPGCHVIAKLIFIAFNKRAEIPANWHQPGSCNQVFRWSFQSFWRALPVLLLWSSPGNPKIDHDLRTISTVNQTFCSVFENTFHARMDNFWAFLLMSQMKINFMGGWSSTDGCNSKDTRKEWKWYSFLQLSTHLFQHTALNYRHVTYIHLITWK